jgi:surfeit locus 1 family protein
VSTPLPTPKRNLLSAAIATAVSFAILISLGVWQLQRLRWKEKLLADIAHAEQAPVIPLGNNPVQFTKIEVHGTWRPATALYGVDVRPTANGRVRMGAQRLQILARENAPPLLVDQGWVSTEGGEAPPVATGAATVQAYVRAPEHPGLLSAEDDAAGRHFYTLDPTAIGTALGAPDVARFTLVAMGPAAPGAPVPADSLPRPPNNHLQYAFTWFGLAAALLGVFGAWVRSVR